MQTQLEKLPQLLESLSKMPPEQRASIIARLPKPQAPQQQGGGGMARLMGRQQPQPQQPQPAPGGQGLGAILKGMEGKF